MAYDRTLLAKEELEKFLTTHPSWRVVGGALEKTYSFASFLEAIGFVNRVAAVAEHNDHHPDIDVRYRSVTLRLTTHDAGGLTFRDPKVAAECDAVAG